jgi:hypothetical protein
MPLVGHKAGFLFFATYYSCLDTRLHLFIFCRTGPCRQSKAFITDPSTDSDIVSTTVPEGSEI